MKNGTLLQYFHWYYPADGSLWKKLRKDIPLLKKWGITAIWLPPAFKGYSGGYSIGYDAYDIYDLGEFDQKGSVRTKYGLKEEYIDAVKAVHKAGIQVYADVVMNHKAGADEVEKVKVKKVNPENRNEFISNEMEIEAYTKFNFPGRKGKYSKFIWDHQCFSGIDFANDTGETAIFSIQNQYGDAWEDVLTDEKGNYDYLMYADIDFRNPAVREELKHWGEWYYKQIHFNGVRLDAIKHISPAFINEWVDHMRAATHKDLFIVGEYWAPGNLSVLLKYIEVTEKRMSLFDTALHYNLHAASNSGNHYDMRTIFDETLVHAIPELAVTMVENHDTQPLQSLEAPVEPWFKPIAYALVLLREKGYPSVFYPDLFGSIYTDKGLDGNDYEIYLPPCQELPALLEARKDVAYGIQRDYFDHPNCIGWTREGISEKKGSGCAVVLSNGDAGNKFMEVGKKFAGKKFTDYLQKHPSEVVINQDGWAEFYCQPGSVSVWVQSMK